jgi:RNA 3'-terminal phosphate cyclase
VGVVLQHLLRNMASDITNSFISGAAFGEIRNERMAVVVPPALNLGLRPSVALRYSRSAAGTGGGVTVWARAAPILWTARQCGRSGSGC